ncbi:Zinc Finger C3H1 Domain-Containing Protein [Manis pentadactyla]|nr:Zinc Finger C3H1 Domain-Containing Protein [Manis pentadactyla]
MSPGQHGRDQRSGVVAGSPSSGSQPRSPELVCRGDSACTSVKPPGTASKDSETFDSSPGLQDLAQMLSRGVTSKMRPQHLFV